jgi:hypothetical protein
LIIGTDVQERISQNPVHLLYSPFHRSMANVTCH